MNKHEEEKLDVKEDEKHLLLDHNYDNIQELNHPLPSWWSGIWWITIVYGVGYFAYYQFFNGPNLEEEFHVEYKAVVAKQAEYKLRASAFDQVYYDKVLASGGVSKGKEVYEMNCLPCHADGGIGDVGPNLTDDHWLVAKGTPETVYKIVFNGSEANGMPIWSDLISKEEIYQSVAYVMTFKNTFKKGKEPEGVKVVDN